MLDAEAQRELVKLVGCWAESGKDELAHHGLDVLAEQTDNVSDLACPACMSTRTEDTGTFKDPRQTCLGCGQSWNPKEVSGG